MEYKFTDVLGLISYTIANYKSALISRMNSLGYAVPFNISNEDLRDKLVEILNKEGLDRIKTILEIKISPSVTTATEKSKLSSIFKVDPSSKSVLEYLSDFILPSSTTVGGTTTTFEEKNPVFSKTVLVATVVIGIVAMFIAYKMK